MGGQGKNMLEKEELIKSRNFWKVQMYRKKTNTEDFEADDILTS